uniref:Uncharacterized protein n=1 Tax=Chromera velia CCMP2878 TaxID=1169474 RepID=A0A0G4GV84_9ALVE|eukprot:Cvel_5240.t1-p1 / transcript=Cvel_5240.t1 / gene=Cvel_5240 / organism=Chromera_velia_CCMP2878 / gene_product=hypothetical protein / transcript_product=hypothetical protein / location=Cvel_scaffold241:72591-74017(+) / protein_length=168 / sequence_SO=supercontig / SO=protein_coding / is_pseudo=false
MNQSRVSGRWSVTGTGKFKLPSSEREVKQVEDRTDPEQPKSDTSVAAASQPPPTSTIMSQELHTTTLDSQKHSADIQNLFSDWDEKPEAERARLLFSTVKDAEPLKDDANDDSFDPLPPVSLLGCEGLLDEMPVKKRSQRDVFSDPSFPGAFRGGTMGRFITRAETDQ